jgi:hypothetical protein
MDESKRKPAYSDKVLNMTATKIRYAASFFSVLRN